MGRKQLEPLIPVSIPDDLAHGQPAKDKDNGTHNPDYSTP